MKTTRFYQNCLKDELTERIARNTRYSLRAFANALGVHPATLSRILSGEKIPTPSLSRKILEKLDLSSKDEQKFLMSMAKAYEEDGVQRKRPEIKELLKRKDTSSLETRDLTPEIFRVISDWYHYAILQLAECQSTPSDPKWIASELNIQEIEAKLAIERLQELEMVKEENGKLVRTVDQLTTGDLRITTQALRKRIKQISEKSVHSLMNDPIEERNHTTMTMNIDPEKLPVAKKMIQEFMDKLSGVLETKKKRVYELQINLFPLQKRSYR